jgi:DNA polymerase III gamma/tau subunit
MELADKYRPKKLDQVIGQEGAVKTLKTFMVKDKIPHVMVFTGPSGCGKTTFCRILRRLVGCKGKEGADYKEINASIARGIDTIREIQNLVNLRGVYGESRVWVIDEAHGLTKDAQNSLLKILENASEGKPDHAYFMLCTTEPQKLLKTIMTRANEIKVKAVKGDSIRDLILEVWKAELGKGPPCISFDELCEVIDRIIDVCEGSPRKALKILQQIIDLESVDEMMEAIQASDFRNAAFDLVKVMLPFKGRANWNEVAKVLNGLKDEEPEGIRRLILAVCKTHMLKGGPLAGRAFLLYGHFQDNYYDTGMTGLVASCFGAVHS